MATPENYRNLISAIESIEVFLIRSVAWREEDIHWPLQVNVQFNVDRSEHRGQQLNVTAVARVTGTPDPSGTASDIETASTPAFQVEMTWRLVYTLSEDRTFPSETIQRFVDRNAVLNLWPYIREYVSAVSARMNLPVLYLPAAKFLR